MYVGIWKQDACYAVNTLLYIFLVYCGCICQELAFSRVTVHHLKHFKVMRFVSAD